MKCDELKERWFEAYPVEGDQLIPVEVYCKKDTDEVIEDLNDKLRNYPLFIAMLESDKLEILNDKIKIRHHKYKRCVAMARWCRLNDSLTQIESERLGLAQRQVFFEYRRKAMWWNKWYKRWLKFAEKFKEAK